MVFSRGLYPSIPTLKDLKSNFSFQVRSTAQDPSGHGDPDGVMELSTTSGSSSIAPSSMSTSVSSMKDQRLQRVAEQLAKLKMAVDKGGSEPHEIKGSPQNGSSSKVAEATPNLVGEGNVATSSKTQPSETEGTKAGKSENEYVLPAHVPCLSWIKLKRCNPRCFYTHMVCFGIVFITMF